MNYFFLKNIRIKINEKIVNLELLSNALETHRQRNYKKAKFCYNFNNFLEKVQNFQNFLPYQKSVGLCVGGVSIQPGAVFLKKNDKITNLKRTFQNFIIESSRPVRVRSTIRQSFTKIGYPPLWIKSNFQKKKTDLF